MKTLITVLFLFSFTSIFAQGYEGDFVVYSYGTSSYNLTIRLVSLPYEGKTDSLVASQNRIGIAQNGSYHKHFFHNGQFVLKHVNAFKDTSGVGVLLDMVSCFSSEISGAPVRDSMWLFGKYHIKLEFPSTQEVYEFYFNALDSKYGANNIGGVGIRYSRDWGFFYHPAEPFGKRLIIQEGGGLGTYMDTVHAGVVEEFSVWDMLYNRSQPWERKFYARSTPFGISTRMAEDTLLQRDLIIGTTIILDTVYLHTSSSDKYGYNTDSLYYFNQLIPFNSHGNTFITPGQEKQFNFGFSTVYGIKIIAAAGDTMIMKKNKRLFVYGQGLFQGQFLGDTLLFRSGSSLIREDSAAIITSFGGVFIDSGATMNWNNYSYFRALENTAINLLGTSYTVNNKGYIKIDGNAHLNLGDNTVLTFDGADSYLQLDSNSNVKLGTNAKIIFKNGAYLKADKATFNTFNNVLWNGLHFEDAGSQTSITRCTFNNAKYGIKINNTSAGVNNNIIIKKNTFNIPNASSGLHYGIHATACNSLLIDSNKFQNYNKSGAGIYINQPVLTGGSEGAGGGEAPFSLNITDNRFINHGHCIVIQSMTSSFLPYFIYRNYSNETGDGINIIGSKIGGTLKSNAFYSDTLRTGAFVGGAPYFYKNIFKSIRNNALHFTNSSPKLAPFNNISEEALEWEGGENSIRSNGTDALVLQGKEIVLSNGYNKFNIPSYSPGNAPYHIFGSLTNGEVNLGAIRNCWNGGGFLPNIKLFKNSATMDTLINVYTIPLVCDERTITGYIVTNLGNGIYDTLFTSDHIPNSEIDPDEELFNEAHEYYRNEYYTESITACKMLIDDYPSSSFLISALYDMYACHEFLDTNLSTSQRDILYGSLKTYLENKISSSSYGSEFNSTAYDFVLSCMTNMYDYNVAYEGYEFISLYHPNPEVRLMASQDYAVIEELLEGEGGSGLSSKASIEDLFNRKVKSLDKRIINDPILSKVKADYQKINKIKEAELTKQLRDVTEDQKQRIIKKLKENEDMINDRIRTNLILSRGMSEQDKENRRIEDLILASSLNMSSKEDLDDNPPIPLRFSLSQNYPNPFNPVTTINYQLPRDGIISFIIYDITGKQVAQIENGFKTSGSYSITFDGSQLSSGVYFYKLTAGNFSETKRMLMIK